MFLWLVTLFSANNTWNKSGQFTNAIFHFADTVSLPANSVVLKTVTALITRLKELRFSSQTRIVHSRKIGHGQVI